MSKFFGDEPVSSVRVDTDGNVFVSGWDELVKKVDKLVGMVEALAAKREALTRAIALLIETQEQEQYDVIDATATTDVWGGAGPDCSSQPRREALEKALHKEEKNNG